MKRVLFLSVLLLVAGVVFAEGEAVKEFSASESGPVQLTPDIEGVRDYCNISWSNGGDAFVVDAWAATCGGLSEPVEGYLSIRNASDPAAEDLDVAIPDDNLFADITAWTCDDDKVVFTKGGGAKQLAYVNADGSTAGASETYLSEDGSEFSSPNIVCDFPNNKEYLSFVENTNIPGEPPTQVSNICIIEYTIGEMPDYDNKICITDNLDCNGSAIQWARFSPSGRPSPDLDKIAISCQDVEMEGAAMYIVTAGIRAIYDNDGEGALTVLDETDSENHVIKVFDGFTDPPTWSLDGEYLVYKGADGINIIKAEEGAEVTQLAADEGKHKSWYSFSANGAWIGYSAMVEGCVAKSLFILPVITSTTIDATGGDAEDIAYSKVEVPEDAVDAETIFALVTPPLSSMAGTDPADITPTNIAKELTATEGEEEKTDFDGELNVTLHYLDKEVESAGITDEETLTIYSLNEETDEWEPVLDADGNPVEPVVDAENNTVTVPTSHFSTYKIVSTEVAAVGDDPGDDGEEETTEEAACSSSGCSLVTAGQTGPGILLGLIMMAAPFAGIIVRRRKM